MSKHHMSVRLRLLSFLCILCASIFLMPFAVSASSDDPFDVLGPDSVSAAPTPNPAEPSPAPVVDSPVAVFSADPPMLLAAAPNYQPYVSKFGFVDVCKKWGAPSSTASDIYTSQPFNAPIADTGWGVKGSILIKSAATFYDVIPSDRSYKFFRVHYSIDNSFISFVPNVDVSNVCRAVIYLYYVSDAGDGLRVRLNQVGTDGDLYCKIPSDMFADDGYFYITASGAFSESDMTVKTGQVISGLNINDFVICTDSLSEGLVEANLATWEYVAKEQVLPYPDSGVVPLPSDDPSVTSAPATSDPALGNIDDTLNQQMQQDQQQHEETKGLLGRIIDGITSIPGKIIELLTDALKALFIPSDDFLNTKLQSFQDDLDNMGFLAWPVSASIDFLELLLNASGSSGEITLPAAKFNMGGKTITIWEETTFNFAEIKKNVPVLFDTLNVLFGLLILVLVCQRAYSMWVKYFGQKPADVFSAIDIDDAGFSLEADRLDRQGYGL